MGWGCLCGVHGCPYRGFGVPLWRLGLSLRGAAAGGRVTGRVAGRVASGDSLRRREPASPRMTVMGFLGSVQNWSRTGEKASRLLSSWGGDSRGQSETGGTAHRPIGGRQARPRTHQRPADPPMDQSEVGSTTHGPIADRQTRPQTHQRLAAPPTDQSETGGPAHRPMGCQRTHPQTNQRPAAPPTDPLGKNPRNLPTSQSAAGLLLWANQHRGALGECPHPPANQDGHALGNTPTCRPITTEMPWVASLSGLGCPREYPCRQPIRMGIPWPSSQSAAGNTQHGDSLRESSHLLANQQGHAL